MGPRSGLEGCGKSRPHRIRSPDRPARNSVAIPTELSQPTDVTYQQTLIFTYHVLKNYCVSVIRKMCSAGMSHFCRHVTFLQACYISACKSHFCRHVKFLHASHISAGTSHFCRHVTFLQACHISAGMSHLCRHVIFQDKNKQCIE